MPRLRQPSGLEDLALTASVQFLRIKGEDIIKNMPHADVQTGHRFLETCVNILYMLYDFNVPYYLFDKLKEEVYTEIQSLIDHIKKSVDMKYETAKFINMMHVAVSLSEVIISRHLQTLHFDRMPKMIRQIIYHNLHRCKGLLVLDMGSMSGGWKTPEMEHLYLNGLQTMHNLREVILNYDCTDAILALLAQTAPKLHYIDMSNSKYVTNTSIDHLLKFRNLKAVQLYRTSVTMEGYANLLLYSEELTDIGRYDEIGRVLEYLDEWYPSKKTFKLKKFITSYATTRHLQLLCDKCPDIDTVSIFHNVGLIDLMTLIGINKLSTLKILSCDFFNDKVRDILQVKGCNLTHLHLEHVDEIDINALLYISQYCPDLKSLSLYNCELIDSTSIYFNRPAIPPFMNLEKLVFASAGKRKHLDFILKNAIKIKYISFGSHAPVCDMFFNDLLVNNPLQYLEELRIINSDQLTIATAYKVVNSCEKLTSLKELEGWNLVKEKDIDAFRVYIKLRNIDLDITPWRKEIE